MSTRTYSYGPKPLTMLLSGGFFTICAIVLGYVATTNNRGLVIDRVIHLGRQDANIFYAVLAVLSAAFVLVAIVATMRGRKDVEIGDDGITAPAGVSRTAVTVRYGAITGLQMQQVRRIRFLTIRHKDGKIVLTSSQFLNVADFDTVAAQVQRGVEAARRR